MVLSAAGGASVLAGRKASTRKAGEAALLSAAAAAAAALFILAFMLLNHDYRSAYVYEHADRNMGVEYLLCAVWGGQAGSLAFWAALQTFFTAAVVLFSKDKPRFVLGFLAAFQTYFIALVLFHSNPFEPVGHLVMRGLGMNPLLLNPFMAVHPPTLFLGFVGFSVPTAFAFNALLERKFRPEWLDAARPWILFAWLFLSVGNLLGMVWAYEELGWGGYWGWDPVENASFMPWLTSTALIHIALIKKPGRLFASAGVILPPATFALIVFGTFITRSGVIQSVHAFSDTTVGPYLLGLIIALVLMTAVLVIVRRKELVPQEGFGGILGTKSLVRATFWILLLSTAFVWIGTMAPLFTELFKGEKVASTPEFFNKWMVPLGLSLFLVLGVCLWIADLSRRSAESRKARLFALLRPLVPAIAAAGIGAAKWGGGEAPALISFALIGWILGVLVPEIFRLVRRISTGKSGGTGGLRSLGAQLVHAAVVALFLGFTGEAYTTQADAVMQEGDTLSVGDYRVQFLGLRDDNDYQKYAVYADLNIRRSGRPLGTFSTGRFFYHSHSGQPTSEVSIVRSLSDDLFLILGNIDENTGATAIRAVVNPLVSFIWIGGVLLVFGTIIGLRAATVRAPAEAEAEKKERRIGLSIAAAAATLIAGTYWLLDPLYPTAALIAVALVLSVWAFARAVPVWIAGGEV